MTTRSLHAVVAAQAQARAVVALAMLASGGCGGIPPSPSTAPCREVGDARVAAAADLAALARCASLRSLTVRSGAALELAGLTALEAVAGDVSIGPTVAVDLVELRELRRIGGTLRIAGNGALSGVFLPRLETVGRIEIEDNPALTTVAMPQLTQVRGLLRLANDADLEAISMNSLRRAGELGLAALPRLGVLQLDGLRVVDTWSVAELPAVDAAEVAALRLRVSGGLAP
jgi:hypothetical protein